MSVKESPPHNVIWDLSGTLFRPTNRSLSEQQVADFSLLFYMWSGKRTLTKLDAYALQLMNQAQEMLPQYQVIRLHTGEPVPSVVCSLLAGLIDSYHAFQLVMKAAQQSSHAALTQEELIQVYRMIKAFFDPVSLAICAHPIEENLKLVTQCAQNPANRLYILSNWTAESFDVLSEKAEAQTVLDYFKRDHIMISADVGYIKPQPEIFELFLAKYYLDPSTCFFIDDQKENIEGAYTFGIQGVHYKANERHTVEHALKKHQII